MSWQLVKIFFSEMIIPRKLIFGRNVPCVGLFKICSYGSEYFFRTGNEKPRKLAKSLKIFSRTASATGEQKTVL
jgi:hypothetical protein